MKHKQFHLSVCMQGVFYSPRIIKRQRRLYRVLLKWQIFIIKMGKWEKILYCMLNYVDFVRFPVNFFAVAFFKNNGGLKSD